MSEKVAIIIGNEGNGLSDNVLELADINVMIPMPGNAESFNASAAASILIYECMRQKKRRKKTNFLKSLKIITIYYRIS